MKRYLLPLILLSAFALLAVAIVVDCVRLAGDARGRVEMADGELRKYEERLVTLLAASPQVTPQVTESIAAYRAAKDSTARHAAYQQVVASFRQTMNATADATNPLDRKFMDDTAGAINRREVAEKPYDDEMAKYRAYLGSWRGSLARFFSSTAHADWAAARSN
jgi:hypothetical protein